MAEEKKDYEVVVSRSTYTTKTILVRGAVSEEDAKKRALQISYNLEWSTTGAYYETEHCEPIEGKDVVRPLHLN